MFPNERKRLYHGYTCAERKLIEVKQYGRDDEWSYCNEVWIPTDQKDDLPLLKVSAEDYFWVDKTCSGGGESLLITHLRASSLYNPCGHYEVRDYCDYRLQNQRLLMKVICGAKWI